MAHNYSKWPCRYCGLDALDHEPARDQFKCLVCLRLESAEETLQRNVKVTVENPQYLKEGQVFALHPSFLRTVLE